MTAYNCPFGRACCDGCNYLITGGCIAKQNTSQVFSITHDDMVARPVSKEIGDYDHKAVMESLHPELKEEPVSGDLGEYINELSKQFPEVSFAKLSRIAVRVAKWQKEQFEKDYTDLCNGIATAKGLAVIMAYDKGMADAREQMMANAVEGVVHHFEKCKVACVHYNDPTGVPMAYFTSPEGLSAGDKVKIIVIKEG